MADAVLGLGHQLQMSPLNQQEVKKKQSTVNHSVVPVNQPVFKTDWARKLVCH